MDKNGHRWTNMVNVNKYKPKLTLLQETLEIFNSVKCLFNKHLTLFYISKVSCIIRYCQSAPHQRLRLSRSSCSGPELILGLGSQLHNDLLHPDFFRVFVCEPEQLLWTRANPRSKLASGILNKKCSDNRSKLRTIHPFLPTLLLIFDIVFLMR